MRKEIKQLEKSVLKILKKGEKDKAIVQKIENLGFKNEDLDNFDFFENYGWEMPVPQKGAGLKAVLTAHFLPFRIILYLSKENRYVLWIDEKRFNKRKGNFFWELIKRVDDERFYSYCKTWSSKN